MQRHFVALGLLSACMSVVACTAPRAGTRAQRLRATGEADRSFSHSRDVLRRGEIAAHSALARATLMDAIVRLRPEYVSPTRVESSGLTTSAPSVVVNGGYRGGLEILRGIDVSTVMEIRFVRSTEAMARFGSEYRS